MSTKPVIQDQIWAGTETSLAAYVQQMESVEARMAAGPMDPPDDEEDKPYLLDVKDGVGIVSIRGPLSNRDNWMTRMFGMSTYPAIREALVSAASNPDVSQILLDIDSGGGAVSGVADVANLISMIDSKVKPVTAFTDGTMASAAYWLGSSAGKVYSSKVATVGSIGVIATHFEQSKMLKEAGIGVTVMRAGKFKALANGVEPLNDKAKEQIQEQLDAAYTVFVQHVADSRNVSYDVADQQMAQGKEFFGTQAVQAGLVDGIETFDSVFSRLHNDTIDKRSHVPENRAQFRITGESGLSEVTMAGRQALTEQQIAAIAESAAASGEAAASADPAAAEAVAAKAAEGAAEAASGEPNVQASEGQLVSYLQAQLKESNEALLQSKVQIATLTEKLAASESVVGDLTAIASKSLNNMQVALGGSALDLTAQSPLAVVTEHKRISAQFMDKFKAGGVAAVDAAHAGKGDAAVQDSLTKARLAATQFRK